MTLRRGFKSEANIYAREIRADLGLAADAPICPFATAEHLGVPVFRLSSYASEFPLETAVLSKKDRKIAFSAMTACLGSSRAIIYNDFLPTTRVHADIMHEISHIMLMHPPHRLSSESGGRHYDDELEEEANWLGPALLVSEEAALTVAQSGLGARGAAQLYKVSQSLMQMRLNVTGAFKRAARAA